MGCLGEAVVRVLVSEAVGSSGPAHLELSPARPTSRFVSRWPLALISHFSLPAHHCFPDGHCSFKVGLSKARQPGRVEVGIGQID